jgi:hypothetical protein
MLLAGLRRLFLLLAGAVGVTAAGSVLVGLVVGSSLGRALTIGFYLAGCFVLVAGFFVANRGPARVKSETAASGGLFPFVGGGRRLRWATLGEQNESINLSAVFVVMGLVLVAIGALFDSRHSFF